MLGTFVTFAAFLFINMLEKGRSVGILDLVFGFVVFFFSQIRKNKKELYYTGCNQCLAIL